MVQFTQIYEKSLLKSMSFFAVLLLLNSCASQSTSLFELRDQQDSQSFELSEYGEKEIQKSSVYYLGVFTAGEYDRFESNIFDQLRVSLHSEARFRYPEYELVNVKQLEEYRWFKTTYTVKGELISKYSVKQKMDLMTNGIALEEIPSKESLNAMESPAISNPTSKDTISFSAKSKAPKGVSSRFAPEGKEVAEVLEEAKQSLDTLENMSLPKDNEIVAIEVSDANVVDALANEILPISVDSLPLIPDSVEVIASAPLIDEEPVVETPEPEEPEEIAAEEPAQAPEPVAQPAEKSNEYPIQVAEEEVEEVAPKNTTSLVGTVPPKTVYIVACFQLNGFVEEKVTITQEEIGHPLAYYRTDKWIRVYLDAEFANVQEAKQVWNEAWPLQFGK
jgi:hypothetical protein